MSRYMHATWENRMRLSRTATLAATAAATLAVAVPAATAAPTTILATGGTTVDAAPALTALGSLGVDVGLTGPASISGTEVTFPVTVGRLGVRNEIRHIGGLEFSAGGTTVGLSRYTIDLDAGVLTAQVSVDGQVLGRVPVFDLAPTQAPVLTRRTFSVQGVKVDLTQGAADLLNKEFGVDAFTGDTPVGTARVQSRVIVSFSW